jgi:hypothetical protein
MWPDFRCCLGSWLEGLRKLITQLSQHSRSLRRNLNPRSPDYDAHDRRDHWWSLFDTMMNSLNSVVEKLPTLEERPLGWSNVVGLSGCYRASFSLEIRAKNLSYARTVFCGVGILLNRSPKTMMQLVVKLATKPVCVSVISL